MVVEADASRIIHRGLIEERVTLGVRAFTEWWLEFAKYLTLVVAIGVASAPSQNWLVKGFSQVTELALLAYVASFISGWVITPVHPKHRLARTLTSAAATIIVLGGGYLLLGYAIETVVHELRRLGGDVPLTPSSG
jgi:hypothetical protein